MKLIELLKVIICSEMVRGYTLNGNLLFSCVPAEVGREYYDTKVLYVEIDGTGAFCIGLNLS